MSTITKPRVPDGLRDLMKDLTREILKEKPSDIYDFAENYFQSRLPEKENYAVKSFEDRTGKYDFSYIQNPQRYQIPVALVYSIIPEGLTNLIKDLIKAVLREQPQNLCDFAVEYFRHVKAATSTESQVETKGINYSAYENYFINKERFLFTPYVKCTCGRTLGEAYSNNNQIENLISVHKLQNNDSTFQSKSLAGDDSNNNNVNKISENNTIYYEKYMNSIYIIQRYIRRYLKEKHATTETNQVSPNHNSLDQHSMTTETPISKQYEHAAQTIPIVPQLQLNQNEAENISEDASYTSASTALLSATESGRETSEPSTTESILTKTILEGVEMENDGENISKYLRQSNIDHVQDEAVTNNNDKNDGNNVKVAEETKDAAKLLNYTIDSKNEGLESKEINRIESGETYEKPVEEIVVEGKTNVETKRDIEEMNALEFEKLVSVNSGTVNSTHNHADIDNANAEGHNKDLNKDKSFSEQELSAENKIIKRESISNLTQETNEVENNDELDKNKECLKSQEIAQTNITLCSGNISDADDKLSSETCKDELRETTTDNKIDQESIKNSADEFNGNNIHIKAELTTNVKETGNQIKNEKYSDKSVLENVMEISSDKSEKHDHKSEIETNEADHDADKIRDEANIEICSQESSQREWHEKNSKSIELDHNLERELEKTQTQHDPPTNVKEKISTREETQDSADRILTTNSNDESYKTLAESNEVILEASFKDGAQNLLKSEEDFEEKHIDLKLDNKSVLKSTQEETHDSADQILTTNSNDESDKTLAESNEVILDASFKDGAQNLLKSEEDFEEKHVDLKLDNKSVLIDAKNNDEGKSSESIKKEFEINSENEEINKVGTILPNKIDLNNQEASEATDEDELNRNSEVIDQITMLEKDNTDTNAGLKEKSHTNASDRNENDKNVVKRSVIISDTNKNNSHNLLEKEADFTNDKISDDVIELKDDININLNETSDRIKKELSNENKIDMEKREETKLVDFASKNSSIDTNDHLQSQTIISETSANLGEIVQPELKDNDINPETKSEKSSLDVVEKTTTTDAVDKIQEGVLKSKSDEVVNSSEDVENKNAEFNESNTSSHTLSTNDKFQSQTEIDETGENLGEVVQTELKIQEISSQNSKDNDINLKTQFEKSIVDAVETKSSQDAIEKEREGDLKSKSDEVVNISEGVGNKHTEFNESNGTTTSDANDKFKSQTKIDETSANLGEVVQTELKMEETSTQNSNDNDINLKTQFEKSDAVETTSTKDGLEKGRDGVLKSKSDEVVNNSDNIENKNHKLNESNGTRDISGKTKDEISNNLHDKDNNTVADESLIGTNNIDEITDKDIQNNMLENITLAEENKSTDELKVENEVIQTQSETKSVPKELSEQHEKDETSNVALQSELDKYEKHEVNKIETIEPNVSEKVDKNVQESSQSDLNENSNRYSSNTSIKNESNNNMSVINTETDKSGDSSNEESASKMVLDKNITSIDKNINLTTDNLTQKEQSESNLKKAATDQTEVESFKKDSDLKTEEVDNRKDIPEIKNDSELSEDKNNSTNSISSDSQHKNVDTKSDDKTETHVKHEQNTNMPQLSQSEENCNENIDHLAIKNSECNLEENTVMSDLKDVLTKQLNETKYEITNSGASELHNEISSTKLEAKNDKKFESELTPIEEDHKIDHDLNKTENSITGNKSNLLKESFQSKPDEISHKTSDEPINRILVKESNESVDVTNAEDNQVKTSPETPKTNINETNNNEAEKKLLEESSINALNDNNMTDELINKTFTLKSSGSTDTENVNKNLEEILQTELNKNKNNVNSDNTISDNKLDNIPKIGNVTQDFSSSSDDLMLKHKRDENTTEELITKSCVKETQMERPNEVSNLKYGLDEDKGTESTINMRNVEPSENKNDVNIDTDKQIKTEDPEEVLNTNTSNKQLDISSENSTNSGNKENEGIKIETPIETPLEDANKINENITTENKNENLYESRDHETKDQSEAIFEEDDAKKSGLDKNGTTTPTKVKHNINPITLQIESEESQSFEDQTDQNGDSELANSDLIKSHENIDTKKSATLDQISDSKPQLELAFKTPSTSETDEGKSNSNSDSTKENDEKINTTNSDVVTTGIKTVVRINDNNSQLDMDVNETVEQKSQTKHIQESQENESERKADNESSLAFKLENTNKNLQIDGNPLKELNEAIEEIQLTSKHEDSFESQKEKTSIPIDINIAQNEVESNLQTNSKNSAQIDPNLNDVQQVGDKDENASIGTNISQNDFEKSNFELNPKNSIQLEQDFSDDLNVGDKEEKIIIPVDTQDNSETNSKNSIQIEQNLNDDQHIGDKNEKTSIPFDTKISQNDPEKSHFEINSKNSSQIDQNINNDQKVGDKEENNNKSVTNLEDLNAELILEKEGNKEHDLEETNSNEENIQILSSHGNNEIVKSSLKSEEIEAHNDKDSGSKLRNKREVDNDNNDPQNLKNDLGDTLKSATIKDEQLKETSEDRLVLRLSETNVIGENISSNEGEAIQPDSVENRSNLSESESLLNISNNKTSLEKDYQMKTSSVTDIEIDSQTMASDIKSLDVNKNNLQTSICDNQKSGLYPQQQNENVTFKLLQDENEANAKNQTHTEVCSNLPPENEIPSKPIKTTSSNQFVRNEQNIHTPNKIEKENVNSSTIKLIETTENKDILNVQENTYDPSKDVTSDACNNENNNNVQSVNKNIAKSETVNASNDQSSLGHDESKTEFEVLTKQRDLQAGSKTPHQYEPDVTNVNEKESVDHSKTERDNIIGESHADVMDSGKTNDTTDSSYIRSEQTLSSNLANIKTINVNEACQEISKKENTEQPNTDVAGENINDEETTHNIGIQTPETLIGNQNLTIGRIRNFNEGLLGSISGQRFAETHLRSFWKEYVMNNSMPLSQYNYTENEPKEQLAAGTSQLHNTNQVNETNLSDHDNKNEERTIAVVEPEIIKETIIQSESSPLKNHNILQTNSDSNPSKDIERIPRYFYGVPDTEPNSNTSHSKRKSYKEPTAFTITIGDSNKKHTTKVAKTVEEQSPKPNKEVELLKSNMKLNLTNVDMSGNVDAEPLLDAETPTKLFQDLNEFEYEIHDVDLDITYTIDEIIRLKIENDSQNNSDDNDEHVNEFSEYSLTPEPMLQTIIELSESETPKPPDQLHSIDDDFLANLERISDTTNTSWTTGSKEDNSFISDEFLDEKNQSEYLKEMHKNSNSENKTQGGIYEFAKDDMAVKEMKAQEYEEIIAQAPTPPNDDPFYEDLKETAAKRIQGAYRQFIQKRNLKPISKIEKETENTSTNGDGTNREKFSIENDENLTSHDDVNVGGSTENSEKKLVVYDNNSNCTKLENEENAPTINLLKEVNTTKSKQEVDSNIGLSEETEKLNIENEENLTSQKNIDNSGSNNLKTQENNQQINLTMPKPIQTESFNDNDKNHSTQLVSSDDIANQTKQDNVNIESEQEPIVEEDLIVMQIKNDLEAGINSSKEESENGTLDEKNIDSSPKKSSIVTPEIGKIEAAKKLKEGSSAEVATSGSGRQSSNNIMDANIDATNKDLAVIEDGVNPNGSTNQTTEIESFSSKESLNHITDTNIDLAFNENEGHQRHGKNDTKQGRNVISAEKLKEGLGGEMATSSAVRQNSNNTRDINIDKEIDIRSAEEKHMEKFNSKMATSNSNTESSNNIKDSNIDVSNKDLIFNEDDETQKQDRNVNKDGRNVISAEELEEVLESEVATSRPSSNNVRDTNIDKEIDIRSPEEKNMEKFNSKMATSNSNTESSNNIRDTNINISNKDLIFKEDDDRQKEDRNVTKDGRNVISAEELEEVLESEVATSRPSSNNVRDTNIDKVIDIRSPEEKNMEKSNREMASSNSNNIKNTNIDVSNKDLIFNEDDETQKHDRNVNKDGRNVISAEKLEEVLESEVATSRPSSNNVRDTNIEKEIDIRSPEEKNNEEISGKVVTSNSSKRSSDDVKNTNTDAPNTDLILNEDDKSQKLSRSETKDTPVIAVIESSSSIKDTNVDIKNDDSIFKENYKNNVNSSKQTREISIEYPAEILKEVLSAEVTTSSLDRSHLINIKNANIDVTNKDVTFNEDDQNNMDSNDSTKQTKQIDTNRSENIREEATNDFNLKNSENNANETETQSNDNFSKMTNSSNISKIDNINNEIEKYDYKNETSYDNNINDLKESSIECGKTLHDDIPSDHVYFEPTAPAEEDIQSVVSIENIESNPIIQDQAARKIQKALKNFIKSKSKEISNLGATKKSLKSNWFVGDEPIIANDSLTKTASEIPFEETEAYVELTTNPSQYLVDSSSNLEDIDANNFSRSPTAPVSNRSINSVDLANDQSTNVSKDTVSVTGTEAGEIENSKTDDNEVNSNNLSYRITSNDKGEEKQTIKYTQLIDYFLNSERHYSAAVNHHNKEIIFTSPDITEISKILSNFKDSQKEPCDSVIPYERLEEPCIKKSVSLTRIISDDTKDAEYITDTAINTDTSSSSDIDDTEDSLSTKTVKLHKPDMAITKMQQRRDSTTKISNLDKPKDYNFEEPLVAPMDNIDTDEEGIVVNKLQREETRESSAQSDFDVVIGGEKDDNINFLDSIDIDENFPAKGSLKRVHTIAGDGDAKSLLKNVTIDESIKYIEPPEYELNSGSLCLDDDTAENIRRKMMAYSFSEADSDCFDKSNNNNNNDGTNSESKSHKYDDFNISTALVENGNSSTETESTIVSAVTKIQAGARGYLTRKRLGKASMASDGKSLPHDEINKASFGNAAISESLEYLVQEAAAKRIQKVYRQHYRKRLADVKQKDEDSLSPEFTTSLESTLAQKRSIMLQRGDALHNDSTPDEGNSSSNGSGSENGKVNPKFEEKNKNLSGNDKSNNFDKIHSKKNTADNDNLNATATAKTAATIRAKKIEENKIRWLAMRQNSMPVQIDSEVLRVIPKYMRKKIKSAEGEKKKDRRRLLMD